MSPKDYPWVSSKKCQPIRSSRLDGFGEHIIRMSCFIIFEIIKHLPRMKFSSSSSLSFSQTSRFSPPLSIDQVVLNNYHTVVTRKQLNDRRLLSFFILWNGSRDSVIRDWHISENLAWKFWKKCIIYKN